MAEHIRLETQGDHAGVHAVHVAAFGRRTEADLVDALRKQARPLVSLVAEQRKSIVGHILFTPVTLAGQEALMMGLAPMAVLPKRQRAGIGSALVRAGLHRCRELGTVAAVVLGHPAYYPKFGFSPAARFGLACEFKVPPEVFMAVELIPGALRGTSGTVRYHKAFDDLD